MVMVHPTGNKRHLQDMKLKPNCHTMGFKVVMMSYGQMTNDAALSAGREEYPLVVNQHGSPGL